MKTANTKNNNQIAAVAKVEVINLGLDVHAAKIAVCVQLDGATAQPIQLVAREQLLGWIAALHGRYSTGAH